MPFTTLPSPLSAFTLTIGGAAGAAEAVAVVAATSAVGWLNLLPSPSEAEFPRAALEARGLATAAVAVAAPHGLTLAVAQRVLAAARALPPGPLVVQCATGNRASAKSTPRAVAPRSALRVQRAYEAPGPALLPARLRFTPPRATLR